MILDALKVFLPAVLAFVIGILITPFFSHFFYKNKLWKKKSRGAGMMSEEFKKIHQIKEQEEISTPCVGGIIIWVSVLASVGIMYLLSLIFPTELFVKLNFLSRNQTLVPLGLFFLGSALGLVDDMLEIRGMWHFTRESVWYTRIKVIIIAGIGLLAGIWFYGKLGMNAISVPFDGIFTLGVLFIPFVIFVMLGTFSSGVIDGLDGLSGGVMAIVFIAYAAIAFGYHELDVAALCATLSGGTLAFLWFNIPPARFFMGETGMMGLTVVLATIAFVTDSVLILPIVALPLVITSLSVIIQKLSVRFTGKKVFKVAPLHHHFEAMGWPTYKVTMRYWVLSIMFAIIGIIVSLIS